jgi:hypothetical protein
MSQAVLLGGRNPIIAAGLVGLVWAPASMLGLVLIDDSLTTGTLLLMLMVSPVAAILGAVASFFLGLILYGIHALTCWVFRRRARELFELDDRFRGRDWAFLAGLAVVAMGSTWLTWQPITATSVSSWQASERLGQLPPGAAEISYYIDRDSLWVWYECTVDEPDFLAWMTSLHISPQEIDGAITMRRFDGSTATIRNGVYGKMEVDGQPWLGVAYDRQLRRAYFDGAQQ